MRAPGEVADRSWVQSLSVLLFAVLLRAAGFREVPDLLVGFLEVPLLDCFRVDPVAPPPLLVFFAVDALGLALGLALELALELVLELAFAPAAATFFVGDRKAHV